MVGKKKKKKIKYRDKKKFAEFLKKDDSFDGKKKKRLYI